VQIIVDAVGPIQINSFSGSGVTSQEVYGGKNLHFFKRRCKFCNRRTCSHSKTLILALNFSKMKTFGPKFGIFGSKLSDTKKNFRDAKIKRRAIAIPLSATV